MKRLPLVFFGIKRYNWNTEKAESEVDKRPMREEMIGARTPSRTRRVGSNNGRDPG